MLPSYFLRIPFVFSSYSLRILRLLLGGPLHNAPTAPPIFVVSAAKRGFNRFRRLTATEMSVHNQYEEMKRREFLTTTMAASVN